MVSREQEAYTIVCALQRYEGWISLQRMEVLTDHKSLESQVVQQVCGKRWHEIMSNFDLHVANLPGRLNKVVGALSNWAYPASDAFAETSFYGSCQDKVETIPFNAQEGALVKKHYLLCSIKRKQQVDGGFTRWGRAVCGLRSPLKGICRTWKSNCTICTCMIKYL